MFDPDDLREFIADEIELITAMCKGRKQAQIPDDEMLYLVEFTDDSDDDVELMEAA